MKPPDPHLLTIERLGLVQSTGVYVQIDNRGILVCAANFGWSVCKLPGLKRRPLVSLNPDAQGEQCTSNNQDFHSHL